MNPGSLNVCNTWSAVLPPAGVEAAYANCLVENDMCFTLAFLFYSCPCLHCNRATQALPTRLLVACCCCHMHLVYINDKAVERK